MQHNYEMRAMTRKSVVSGLNRPGRFTPCPELAHEAVQQGRRRGGSASTVRGWLHQDALKPWRHRSWILIIDPHFRPKAARVLDVYSCPGKAGPWARTST